MSVTQDSEILFETASGVVVDLSQLEEMKCRFQRAVTEIRELRQQNAELQRQVAAAAEPSSECEATDGDELSWDKQKEQWLHQMQDKQPDAASPDPAGCDRSSSNQLVVRSLRIRVAELEELTRQLSSQLAEKNAIELVFDTDQVIQEERARLSELQREWQEKLRIGELELSQERAELTRMRLYLEERARTLEAIKEGLQRNQRRPGGGTWRGYLGLHSR